MAKDVPVQPTAHVHAKIISKENQSQQKARQQSIENCHRWKQRQLFCRKLLSNRSLILLRRCDIVKHSFYGQINSDLFSHFKSWAKLISNSFIALFGNIFMALNSHGELLKVSKFEIWFRLSCSYCASTLISLAALSLSLTLSWRIIKLWNMIS